MKVKIKCKVCGKIREVYPLLIKIGKGKFCSRKCHNKWRRKEKIKIKCKTCGKIREVYPSVVKQGGGKFCNYKCRNKFNRGKNNPRWKGGKKTIICKQCGKEKEVKLSQIKYGYGKFCNHECFGEWKSENQKGENNPNWQDGISFEPYSTDWTETLRISIRERDNYTCQLCNKKQGDRTHSVHHIDYDKKNCNPENLITLCVKCNGKVNINRKNWTKYFLSKVRQL